MADEKMPVDLASERERLLKMQQYESDIMISRLYRKGSHLIYDCLNGHYACVSAEGFSRCQDRRAEDRVAKKIELRCAPFKLFSSVEECMSQQMDLMGRLIKKDFCYDLSEERLFQF